MKIRCDNGLCDRLRFIFSYLFKNDKLVVCWQVNKKCNGHFLDVFNPVKNLEFTENDSDIDVYGWKPLFNLRSIKSNIYKDLSLLPELKEQVISIRQKMGKYIAVHIRRTDKVFSKTQKKDLISDNCFIDFIDKNKKYNIFLATDCFHIQNKFKERYGDRLFWCEKITKPWNYTIEDCETYNNKLCPDFRPTTLKSTAVDLFMCIYSDMFMGTSISGMSEFIRYNRKIKK